MGIGEGILDHRDVATHLDLVEERPHEAHYADGRIEAVQKEALGALPGLWPGQAPARRQGFVRVELSAHADNARAIALYRKVGFVQEGVERDAICIDGRYCDTITMAIIDKANRDAWRTTM